MQTLGLKEYPGEGWAVIAWRGDQEGFSLTNEPAHNGEGPQAAPPRPCPRPKPPGSGRRPQGTPLEGRPLRAGAGGAGRGRSQTARRPAPPPGPRAATSPDFCSRANFPGPVPGVAAGGVPASFFSGLGRSHPHPVLAPLGHPGRPRTPGRAGPGTALGAPAQPPPRGGPESGHRAQRPACLQSGAKGIDY